MRGKKNITPEIRQQLCELILTKRKNPDGSPGHGLTNAQIAARLAIHPGTVTYYTTAMAKGSPEFAAILGSSRTKLALEQHGQFKPGEAQTALDRRMEEIGKTATEYAAEFSKQVEEFQKNHPDGNPLPHPHAKIRNAEESGKPLSITEMLSFLSDVARSGPPQYKIAAIKLLDELNAIHRPAESFGPPEPLTPAEGVARLKRLLLAVGPLLTQQTLEYMTWLSTSSSNGTTPTLIWTPPEVQPTSSSTLNPVSSSQEDGSLGEAKPTTSSPSTESAPHQDPTISEESSVSQFQMSTN